MDFALEKEARGPSKELEALMVPLFDKVIPRLLRPLETGGRTVKPGFVHGDLWYGNGEYDAKSECVASTSQAETFPTASNDMKTDRPMVFDAAGFYGHNECPYYHLASHGLSLLTLGTIG